MARCPECLGDPCDCDDPDWDSLDADTEFDGVGFDCGIDARGNCGKAGSEECVFECPNRNVRRN